MKRSRLLLVLTMTVVLSLMAIAMPAKPALAAAGTLFISQTSGTVGSTVQISGSNYTPNTNYTITFRQTPFVGLFSTSITGKVNSSGRFQTNFTIPSFPKGQYEFNATTATVGGVEMDTTAGALPTFYINSSITLSSNQANVGSKIRVSGAGFTSGAPVYIYFDNNPLYGTIAASNGTFSNIEITIPDVVGGSLHLIKVGESPTVTVNQPFTVTPNLFVTPDSTNPGSKVTLSGKGYSASSALTITLDNSIINANVSSDANGAIQNAVITIPAVSAGKHTLKVTDSNGYFATAEITTTNSLTIFPQTGKAGDPIALTGKGFGANKVIVISFDGTPLNITPGVVTDSEGNFTATINIPSTTSGTHTITASDSVSVASTQITTTAIANPVGGNTAKVGQDLSISGSGFKANATVTIEYDNIAMTTAQADATGSFTASIKLPAGTPGVHQVTATDGTNNYSFEVTLQPAAVLDKTKGYLGTQVTLTGDAFKPGNPLTITYDSDNIPAPTVDSNGHFSLTFRIPESSTGKHTITVNDGVNKVTTDFTVEAAPPAAPKIVLPAADTKAGSPAKFEWEAVSSANGKVTYELQIARDNAFSNPVIVKKGLTASSYQLSEEEQKLLTPAGKSDPYYWRVKATNAAGETSDWANPSTFTVGFIMPTWVWYFLGVVGGIVLFGGGFILGRRFEANRL